MPRWLIWANLALLLLFPLSWAAPLMRAGLLPLFGLSEISVLSGIAALWDDDPFLAALVALLALVAPMAKTAALAAVHLGRLPARHLGLLSGLGRLAMADVFLVAVYVTLAKGLGVGRVETAWGLYLFTFCVLAALALSLLTKRRLA
ncbi:paraquat-inducible protein A [Pseudooceanicola aestuarii]|uniref:paraquat-inducible protein A n=1 Tax=Pseudooceanicola aestuarii TaxID=2697319 RepID=UPI001EF9929A|nr:paraquat-inducible protein A [Pseudooceanicola aestuarii]